MIKELSGGVTAVQDTWQESLVVEVTDTVGAEGVSMAQKRDASDCYPSPIEVTAVIEIR